MDNVTNQPEITPNETPPINSHATLPNINLDISGKKKLVFVVLILVLVMAAVSIAWFLLMRNKNGVVKVEIIPPETVTQVFYNAYVNYQGNPLTTGAYTSNPNVSKNFVAYINKLLDTPDKIIADPVMCAQKKPLSVKILNTNVMLSRAEVTIQAEYETPKTIKVILVLEGNNWLIDGVECGNPVLRPETPTTPIVIYFNNPSKEPATNSTCGSVYAVDRDIDITQDPLTSALNALFAGPTDAEKRAGYSSVFSDETKGLLLGLKFIDNGTAGTSTGITAYVNLNNLSGILEKVKVNDDKGCERPSFFTQIEETIKHYKDVKAFRYAFEGDTKKFYGWANIGCYAGNGFCGDAGFK